LTSIPDFTPQSAFERIDRNQSGEISAQEIVDFLKDNAINHVEVPEA
jgi:Ca2+-binding EF-hand superfamily protein